MGEVINAMPEPPKRGRKSKGEIPPEAQSMDLVAKDQRGQQITAVKAFETFGIEGKDYDLVTYTQMGRNVFQLHEATGIIGGRILLVIKANEKHGTFLKALEGMGLHPRTAQRYMNVAKRFGEYDNLSHLNNFKLAVLDELSDSELEKLDAGEDILGLSLDAVDKMTATQLRERVREAKQRLERKTKEYQEDVKKMSAELEELRLRSTGQEPPTKEQLARAAAQRFRDPIIDNILEATERMNRAIAAIDEAQKVPDVPYEALEEMLGPWKESFNTFCDAAADLTDAFNNIHVDKGRG
jgi:molecular chaperone GrpE (heat shock protein)